MYGCPYDRYKRFELLSTRELQLYCVSWIGDTDMKCFISKYLICVLLVCTSLCTGCVGFYCVCFFFQFAVVRIVLIIILKYVKIAGNNSPSVHPINTTFKTVDVRVPSPLRFLV